MKTELKKIRNIALIGHAGEGKTTLAEALLFNAKVTDRLGRVDDGNTVMDFDAEEIAKKSSISLAFASAVYDDYKFNIIDAPGFYDFEGEMLQALEVADSAVVVTGASGTLTVGTEKAVDYCIEHKKPCMIFVSGIDKENASFSKTVEAIREKYPKLVASMFIPSRVDGKLIGFVSISSGNYYSLDAKNLGEIPERLKEKYNKEYNELAEVSACNDEALLDKFAESGTLTKEEVERGVNIGMNQCGCIPVIGGSGYMNQCIVYLKDKMKALLPSPDEANPSIATDELGNEINIACDPNGETVIRIFKTIVDPFAGKLSLFKVVSGTLKVGDVLKNAYNDQEEKISSIYSVCGKKQEAVQEISAGDFGAISKLEDIKTGDTLYSGSKVKFPPFEKPSMGYSMAVYAVKKGDEEKIFAGLKKLKEEDSCFTVLKNEETGEMILSGVGDTQLNVLSKKLKNKFGCEAVLQEPKIAYRETIKKSAEAEGKHKKQGGGAGQFGVASVRFEPGASDGKYEFVDAVVGGAVPKQFIPAVDKGLREAVLKGVLAGYPMVNIKCTLFDGKSHPVDSKEIAFSSAGKLAYQEAIPNASPCLLEPVMSLTVIVPNDFLGAVMGDVNKRRGRILGTNAEGEKQIVMAEVPQAELLRYALDLRSMTQGRGKWTMELARYEEVPPQIAEKIIEKSKNLA